MGVAFRIEVTGWVSNCFWEIGLFSFSQLIKKVRISTKREKAEMLEF